MEKLEKIIFKDINKIILLLKKNKSISMYPYLMSDLEQAEEDVKKLEYIYIDKSEEDKEKSENGEEDKNQKGINKKTYEFPEGKFIVEFNSSLDM